MTAVRSFQRTRFEPAQDAASSRRDADITTISRRLTNLVPLTGVYVAGLRQDNGRFTDGITVAGFASVNIPHGLGRPALGFIIVDQQDAAASLVRGTPPSGMEKTHVTITSTSASSTRVKLVVF